MKLNERRQAVRRLRQQSEEEGICQWLTVRNWIRDMVRIEPRIMRQVAKMKFGNLSNWIEKGKDNIEACGCLVGNVALALTKERNHFVVRANEGGFVHTTDEFKTKIPNENFALDEVGDYAGAPKVVALLVKQKVVEDMREWAGNAGNSAGHLGAILGQNTAVALIKDEITRALKRRANRRKLAHA